MVPIFDPGNIIVLFMLFVGVCIPLSFLTLLIFFAVRHIPNRWAQGLIPLIAGIFCVIVYESMLPPVSDNYPFFMSLTGILIHPLLILSPVMFFQGYLHRIPLPYAVFFTALISLFVSVAMGAMQGDLRYERVVGIQFIWQAMVTVIKDLLIASIIFWIITVLDSFFPRSEEHTS